MGKDMGQPPMAKNQNIQVVSTSQPNYNMGKPQEKGFHRPIMMPHLSSKGRNNESPP
jgi:hypothetical protein